MDDVEAIPETKHLNILVEMSFSCKFFHKNASAILYIIYIICSTHDDDTKGERKSESRQKGDEKWKAEST